MKSLTCSLSRTLNYNRLYQDNDVFTQIFILISNLFKICHSYYNEELRTDKLASFTPSLQQLGCMCLLLFENITNKIFDISTKYKKCVIKFGAKYIEKAVSYLNLFTDSDLL